MNNRVIRDYIASLKEDKELDAGFLILLAHIHYQTDMFPDYVSFGFLERLDNA